MPPNPTPKPAPKAPPKAPTKGKPMGIPLWGWIAAAGAGLVIAYLITKKSGTSTSPVDAGNAANTSPLGSDSGSGGGVVAPPPPAIKPATGDITSVLTDPGNTTPPSTTSSPATTSTTTDTATPTATPTPTPTVADSYFYNANFATSSYVAPSGQTIVGPGGPVIDLDLPTTSAPSIPTPPPPTPSTNPNILPHGQVVD